MNGDEILRLDPYALAESEGPMREYRRQLLAIADAIEGEHARILAASRLGTDSAGYLRDVAKSLREQGKKLEDWAELARVLRADIEAPSPSMVNANNLPDVLL